MTKCTEERIAHKGDWDISYPWSKGLSGNVEIARHILRSTICRLSQNLNHVRVYNEQIEDVLTDVLRRSFILKWSCVSP